jgi:hypothetical protein
MKNYRNGEQIGGSQAIWMWLRGQLRESLWWQNCSVPKYKHTQLITSKTWGICEKKGEKRGCYCPGAGKGEYSSHF